MLSPAWVLTFGFISGGSGSTSQPAGLALLLGPMVTAAVITIVGTLITRAYVDGRLKRLHDRDLSNLNAAFAKELEQIKGQISKDISDAAAQREYEMAMKRRGQEQISPVLAQLRTAGERAHSMIHDLITMPHCPSDGDGYRRVYELVAPLAIARLLESRLTEEDVEVEPLRGRKLRIAHDLRASWEGGALRTRNGPSAVDTEIQLNRYFSLNIVDALSAEMTEQDGVIEPGQFLQRLTMPQDPLRSIVTPVHLALTDAQLLSSTPVRNLLKRQDILLFALGMKDTPDPKVLEAHRLALRATG
jgi:hypothetical protein